MPYIIPNFNHSPHIIPDASSSGSGTMSTAQYAQLNQANLQGDLQLYVDVNGSDSNSGLSASAPFGTLAKALNYAAQHGVGYRINLVTAGNYPLAAGVVFPSNVYGASGIPQVIIGPMNNIFGNRTCTSASASGTVFTDSSLVIRQTANCSVVAGAPANCMRVLIAGYTASDVGKIVKLTLSGNSVNNGNKQIIACNPGVSIDVFNPGATVPDVGPITVTDSYYGSYIECVSGAAAGTRRMIRDNDLTSFTVKNPFGSAISVNDVFAVLQPGGVIQYTNQLTISGGFMGFQGIKFQNRSSGGLPLALSCAQTVFDSCEVDAFSTVSNTGGAMNTVQNAQLFAGVFSVVNLRNWHNDDTVFPAGHQGCGLFYHGGSFSAGSPSGFEGTQGSRINGFYTILQAALSGFEAASMNLTSLDAERVSGQFVRSCGLTMQANTASFPSKWNGQYTPSTSTGLLTMQFVGAATIDGIDMSNSGGDGILCQYGCDIQVNKVTGSGNVGVGLHADRDSYIQIDSSGANNTTVTGTAGDAALGHASPANIVTYAQIRTTDGNGVKGQQDTYGNRIEP